MKTQTTFVNVVVEKRFHSLVCVIYVKKFDEKCTHFFSVITWCGLVVQYIDYFH